MPGNIYVSSGGGKLKTLTALIKATYPEGSTCTCSNGKKTLRAKGKSGTALFNVEPGTWTVTATNGTESASQTVEITAAGQSVSVELSYGLLLYNKGNENIVMTGGWEFFNPSTFSMGEGIKGATAITMKGVGAGATIAATPANKIDLTNCNTITVNVTEATSLFNDDNFIFVSSVKGSTTLSKMEASKAVTTAGIYSLDISAITGSFYVGVTMSGGSSGVLSFDGYILE